MKYSVAILLLLRMAVSVPLEAQNRYYHPPEPFRVGYLPDMAKGTSSLFFLDGRLWTCNDHGPLLMMAIDTVSGRIDSLVDLGVRVKDMEEVCQDSQYLYFGDFGNNRGKRTDLRILRLEKASLGMPPYRFDTITFEYPSHSRIMSRNYDCEAFVCGDDSLYLFTKQWLTHGSVCYALPKEPGHYEAQRRFVIPVDGLLTSACFLPDKRCLVLVGYTLSIKPFIYVIDQFEGEDFEKGRHRRTPLNAGMATQTEGVATWDGKHLFLSCETLRRGSVLRRAALFTLDLIGLPDSSNVMP